MAAETRSRRRWYIAAAATLLILTGGYLYLGPLSPQDSGNSWTTFVLHRPVCDNLLTRDQVRQFIGTSDWAWEQSDATKLTDYTCRLGGWEFSVARFPGPLDRTGGLVFKVDLGFYPQPIGAAGTTAENLTWVALTCQSDQLMVSLNWGTQEIAVRAFEQFAAAIADRQGCRRPELPPYRPTGRPVSQPVSTADPVCGLLDPAQFGSLNGWTMTRSAGPDSPVNHCAVSGPVRFVVSTYSGPFVGPGSQRLDFYSYASVCRGSSAIYALDTALPAVRRAFDDAVRARHNIRCTGR